MVNFNATREEMELISKIIDRANREDNEAGGSMFNRYFARSDLFMDLEACHSNGMPLDFARLLEFPKFDFWHDLKGISAHIDRTNGEIRGFFVPRCAKR